MYGYIKVAALPRAEPPEFPTRMPAAGRIPEISYCDACVRVTVSSAGCLVDSERFPWFSARFQSFIRVFVKVGRMDEPWNRERGSSMARLSRKHTRSRQPSNSRCNAQVAVREKIGRTSRPGKARRDHYEKGAEIHDDSPQHHRRHGSLSLARSATAQRSQSRTRTAHRPPGTTTVHVHGLLRARKCNNSTTVQHGLENIKDTSRRNCSTRGVQPTAPA